jgi:hypothetical protein
MILFTGERNIDGTSEFICLDIFVVFEWRKVGLCNLHAFFVSVYPHPLTLNASTNLYET